MKSLRVQAMVIGGEIHSKSCHSVENYLSNKHFVWIPLKARWGGGRGGGVGVDRRSTHTLNLSAF